MSALTHQTAPTQFVETDGVRYACRRLGPEGTVPLVMLRHFTGNLDNWDPAFVDALATEREVVLVDCPGVSASSGTPATTVAAMAQQMITFAVALGPDRIDLLGFSSGGFVAQDIDPRASFAGHDLMTPWTRLQLAYFSGSAMWTYLAEPLSLTFPGVRTEEIGPWTEDGERFRRLHVVFPDTIATLSGEQTLYVDGSGLIRRRDYSVAIAGDTPAAHPVSGHQEVSGLVVPTTRMIYSRDESGHKVPEPLVVSVRQENITVS